MPKGRSSAAKKAARTRKLRAAGRKAAKTRKRRATARKAAATKKLRTAAAVVQAVPTEVQSGAPEAQASPAEAPPSTE